MAEDKGFAPKLALTNVGKSSSKKRNEEVSTFVYGRKPPQALPLEEASLGAILLEREAINVVLDIES
jgi:replicative DNA helicase